MRIKKLFVLMFCYSGPTRPSSGSSSIHRCVFM